MTFWEELTCGDWNSSEAVWGAVIVAAIVVICYVWRVVIYNPANYILVIVGFSIPPLVFFIITERVFLFPGAWVHHWRRSRV